MAPSLNGYIVISIETSSDAIFSTTKSVFYKVSLQRFIHKMLSTKQTTAVISLRVQVQKKGCLNSMVFTIGTRTLLIASLGLINIKEVKAYNQ